jgi:hypothetical protein
MANSSIPITVTPVEWRTVRDLPLFEHAVELEVPRLRVACPHCGPKLELLAWLEPYARVTRRLAESVSRLVRGDVDPDWRLLSAFRVVIDRFGSVSTSAPGSIPVGV